MATRDNFFQTSDGVWIYYEVKGQGKPIVFVPGFSGSTQSYAEQTDAWAEKYQVIIFDPRSHGRSMKVSGSMRIERMAKDIRELIDHLDLHDVVLMGHSLGGAQVAHYVNHEGCHRLRAAGLIDATLYGFGDGEWNEHACHGYNMDAWLKRMIPYMSNQRAYVENQLAPMKDKMTPEAYEAALNSSLALPAFAGAEMHLSVYHTDNFTPLQDCIIPMGFFTAHSSYHNAWRSHHEAMDRMTRSPLKVMYEYLSNNHGFPSVEKEKFINDVFDFMAKLEEFENGRK